MKKNDFEALKESLKEARSHAQGKITLRTKSIQIPKPPKSISPKEIVLIRKHMGVSQGVFARFLGVARDTEISWEQGRRKPSGPALRLLQIAKKHPEQLVAV